MTTHDPKVMADLRKMLEQASTEQLKKLIDDIRDVKPWYGREPMGRA